MAHLTKLLDAVGCVTTTLFQVYIIVIIITTLLSATMRGFF